MSDQQKYEKQEKDEKDEKDLQKHEEKSMEEKWQRDPLGTLIWALILIWAGLVWLGWNFGVLERYAFLKRFLVSEGLIQPPVWALILIGAGVLILIEVLIRLIVPAYRRSVVGSIIFAAILLGIGLGDIVKWDFIWPAVIIVIGLVIIFQGLLRKKK